MDDERISPEEYLRRLELARQSEENIKNLPAEPEEEPEPQGKQVKKKKKRRKKHYFLRFCIALILIAGAVYALQSSLFYIKNVEVEGNMYYTSAQIVEMSGIEPGKNMFFELRIKQVRDALLESPYISLAEVKRVPPGTIQITITEREEFAAVPCDEGYVIIDDTGLVLNIVKDQPSLPILEGMQIVDMSQGYPLKIEQSYLLTETIDLLKKVSETDLYFKKIYFSTVIVRAYINDDYYCEGTPDEIAGNIESIRKLVEEQYKEGITKGVIRVGSDGYFSYSPKIE